MAKGSIPRLKIRKAVRKDGLFLFNSLIVSEFRNNLLLEHALTYMFDFESGIFTELLNGYKLVILFVQVFPDFTD